MSLSHCIIGHVSKRREPQKAAWRPRIVEIHMSRLALPQFKNDYNMSHAVGRCWRQPYDPIKSTRYGADT